MINSLYWGMFTAESAGELISKIDQHLEYLWARMVCPVFSTHGV